MTSGGRSLLLPRPLAQQLRRLNQQQRDAVFCDDDSVVMAGPGSGKTEMLVAKAAYLAFTGISGPERIAAITYGVQAAEEIGGRLRAAHTRLARRVRSNTVHAFCTSEVLAPFMGVAGLGSYSTHTLVGADVQQFHWQEAYREQRLADNPKYNESRDNACRMALFANESTSDFPAAVVRAAQAYDRRLAENRQFDFDAIVGRSLHILRTNALARRAVVARFPWLLVDEYQDLGVVLHGIVTTLREAGARIFAVGDPDQSILGFVGGSPRHLLNLSTAPGIRIHRLSTNYRSGDLLVTAAAAALGEDRGYRACDGAPSGVLDHRRTTAAVREQPLLAAQAVSGLLASGVAAHHIAVLYPANRSRLPLRDMLSRSLQEAGVEVLVERAQPWPRTPSVRFVQKVASWQLAETSLGSARQTAGFDDLLDDYARLLNLPPSNLEKHLHASTVLYRCLHTIKPNRTTGLHQWLDDIDDALGLCEPPTGAVGESEKDLAELRAVKWATATVADFCGDVETAGKVILTTYHAAKGREWPYVILPCLQEGVIPDWPRSGGVNRQPAAKRIAEDKRLFYVALSRAKQGVILIYNAPALGDSWTFESSPSRFAKTLPGYEPAPPQAAVAAPAYTVDALRRQHANSHKRWTLEDDDRLNTLAHQGTSIADLMNEFGRNENAILARLERLGIQLP